MTVQKSATRKPLNGGGNGREPLLRLENIETFYGPIQILKGIDIEVYPQEVVSLLGGNASGKTTTMKTILGLVKPSEGRITFDGQRIDGRKSGDIISLGLSPVPEARRLFASMTIRENLLMGAYTRRKRDPDQIEQTLEEVLEIFPRLKERIHQFGGTLSGGEQQMVAVARALMARPKLILMDEPSMGLAPALVERVYEVIASIKKKNTAMFIVEQNANMALSVADRGYVLQNGRIVLTDKASKLIRSEKIRSAYLGHG
ncbi:MAG: ABC transporter ATP-binding protein [Hyphomicrobiaceae bacterium]|nr:ABC transporter ATP-binding protein [Hyphomicrobiaceae bacterium]